MVETSIFGFDWGHCESDFKCWLKTFEEMLFEVLSMKLIISLLTPNVQFFENVENVVNLKDFYPGVHFIHISSIVADIVWVMSNEVVWI